MSDELYRSTNNSSGQRARSASLERIPGFEERCEPGIDEWTQVFLLDAEPRLKRTVTRRRETQYFDRLQRALGTHQLLADNRFLRYALASQAVAEVNRDEQLLLGAIRSLAHALEAKDAYTGGHSSRVSAYSVDIARELGLSVAETAAIALGGELHDVGKIGVREDVLHKPGPLTPSEYRHVMEHTVIGAHILSPLLHSRSTVLSIVRWHHERVDGTSLPDGLKGDEIPLAARIVAVADAFDAMTSQRPYRPALSVDAALGELEESAGSQFDVDCAAAARRSLKGKRPASAAFAYCA
jgi:HD-GYP domain-containing protein (c-di-GMP phosphodiesterase class II)